VLALQVCADGTMASENSQARLDSPLIASHHQSRPPGRSCSVGIMMKSKKVQLLPEDRQASPSCATRQADRCSRALTTRQHQPGNGRAGGKDGQSYRGCAHRVAVGVGYLLSTCELIYEKCNAVCRSPHAIPTVIVMHAGLGRIIAFVSELQHSTGFLKRAATESDLLSAFPYRQHPTLSRDSSVGQGLGILCVVEKGISCTYQTMKKCRVAATAI